MPFVPWGPPLPFICPSGATSESHFLLPHTVNTSSTLRASVCQRGRGASLSPP